MWVYKFFKGDLINAVLEMQYQMYDYASSAIFTEVKKTYLYHDKVDLYIDRSKLQKYHYIQTYDHRTIQEPHDCWAAVFRYQLLQGLHQRTLFEESYKEIREYHERKFIDVDFLNNIDDTLWYLTKRWLVFLEEEIRTDHRITREIAHAVLVYNNNLDPDARKERWAAANRSRELIKLKYDYIPWKIPSENTKDEFDY